MGILFDIKEYLPRTRDEKGWTLSPEVWNTLKKIESSLEEEHMKFFSGDIKYEQFVNCYGLNTLSAKERREKVENILKDLEEACSLLPTNEGNILLFYMYVYNFVRARRNGPPQFYRY